MRATPKMKWNLLILATSLAMLVFLEGSSQAAILLYDDFDPGIDSGTFESVQNGAALGDGLGGFLSGNALHFGTVDGLDREATTNMLDLTTGGSISFDFRGGNEVVDGETYWENSEGVNEWVRLYYTTDGGLNFTELELLSTQMDLGERPTVWNHFDLAIPLEAQTSTTQFMFQQGASNGMGFDLWAIDNLMVTNNIATVPEPSTFALLGLGASLVGVGATRRRTNKSGDK